ncbi:MAG TPA: hypothetical protein DCM05_00015 [Elusimicrobia bacterium]|nr:hypothetical protein [Elusimicrobiota bacterium]
MLKIALTGLFIFAAAAPARAADAARPEEKKAEAPASATPAGKSTRQWFKNLLTGLQKSAVEGKYKRVRASAVASVRGAGQEEADPNKPYWKGGLSEKAAAQVRKEREQLASAVELALSGQAEEARARLDAFEKDNPKSTLKKEVQDIRAKLEDLKGSEDEAAGTPEPEPTPEPEND